MKSVNKSTKKNWVQKPRFAYKGTNRPLINNLSGSGLLKKAIFPSSLAFFRRGHCFFLLLLIFFRKIRVDLGRFPFSQNFRKFRLDRKWKTIGRFVPLENSRKSGKSKKVGPFSLLEFSERNFVFHLHVSCTLYQFQLLPTRQPSWCPIG